MLSSEREGERDCKWLPVSIHCLGKLLRKEREMCMWGRLHGQRKGEGPHTTGQSLKIISLIEEKLIGMQIEECDLERDEGNRCNSPETSSPLEANCP